MNEEVNIVLCENCSQPFAKNKSFKRFCSTACQINKWNLLNKKHPKEKRQVAGGCKYCTKCEKEKPFLEFSKNSKSKDGLQGWCRSCHGSKGKKREHKEKINIDPIYLRVLEFVKDGMTIGRAIGKTNIDGWTFYKSISREQVAELRIAKLTYKPKKTTLANDDCGINRYSGIETIGGEIEIPPLLTTLFPSLNERIIPEWYINHGPYWKTDKQTDKIYR